MAWNSLMRFSADVSVPVPMYFCTYPWVSGFSRSAIDGVVSTAPPAMSCRLRTIRPNSAAPWYLAALVNSSSG